MKNYLFATAMTVALLSSAPALAAQGHIGAAATHTEVEVEGLEGDGNAYNVFGAVVLPLNETFAWQFDGDITATDIDGAEDETAASGTAHLYQSGEASKIGGFVGFTNADDLSVWTVGAEGQWNLDNVNLGAAAGYFNVDDLEVDGFGISGSATVFVTDNFSLGGGLGYASGEVEDLDIELDGWTASVGAEYQLSNAPLSIFGGYQRAEVEGEANGLGGAEVEADSITVGVAYSFGTATLKERERAGASLGGLGSLAGLFTF